MRGSNCPRCGLDFDGLAQAEPPRLPTLELTPETAKVVLGILRNAGRTMSKRRHDWAQVGVKTRDLRAVTNWVYAANKACMKEARR